MALLPSFRSLFLQNICRQLEARVKAIGHNAKLKWDTKQPDEFEWLTLNITPDIGHHTIFQFTEDNYGWVYVRSKSRENRGKVLLEIEMIRLVDNAPGIVAAIETTIAGSRGLELEGNSADAVARIRAAWLEVEVRIAPD